LTKKVKHNRRVKQASVLDTSILHKLGTWLLMALALVAVALVLALSIYYGSQSVRQIMQRPIAQVMVKSEFLYVSHDDITALIKLNINHSFLHENLSKVRKKLIENPWIDDVSLSRQWPDRLIVVVSEQKPIARWKNIGFVNHRGRVIKVDVQEKLAGLPELAGAKEDSVEIMQQYHVLSQLLRPHGFDVVSIDKGMRNEWRLSLSNGWDITLGRGQIVEKMQRFLAVLDDQLLSYQDRIAAIDVRYEHGVSIRWRKVDTAEKALTQKHSGKSHPSS